MDLEEPHESDIEHVWSMFSNLGIRRTRAPERPDDQLIKLSHFQTIGKYFENKTFYVVVYHDKYDGPAAFEYTYSLRETTTMGVWMDITASTVEIQDGVEKTIQIVDVELYSDSHEIRICNLSTKREYRRKGNTTRLLHAVFMDLSQFFEKVTVSCIQLNSDASKKFFMSLGFEQENTSYNCCCRGSKVSSQIRLKYWPCWQSARYRTFKQNLEGNSDFCWLQHSANNPTQRNQYRRISCYTKVSSADYESSK